MCSFLFYSIPGIIINIIARNSCCCWWRGPSRPMTSKLRGPHRAPYKKVLELPPPSSTASIQSFNSICDHCLYLPCSLFPSFSLCFFSSNITAPLLCIIRWWRHTASSHATPYSLTTSRFSLSFSPQLSNFKLSDLSISRFQLSRTTYLNTPRHNYDSLRRHQLQGLLQGCIGRLHRLRRGRGYPQKLAQ